MLTVAEPMPSTDRVSQEILVSTPRNPVPGGGTAGHFLASDGARIRFAWWGPTGLNKLGTVCILMGRAEFIEKYFEVISDLRRRGFAVAIMDHRGQGGSSRPLANPRKGHVDDFAQYDADLEQFMAEIVLPDCPAPYYALAHSMGANILLRATRSRMCWFDRIILTAPLIALEPNHTRVPRPPRVAEVLTLCGMGTMHVPGGNGIALDERPFEGNPLTSDAQRYARTQEVLRTAPELALGSPTIGWYHAAWQSMSLLNSDPFPRSVKVPALIVASGNDPIVSLRAIEGFTSRLRMGAHVLIPGARHEVLQERNGLRDQFWAAFDAYIPGARPSRAEQLLGL
ncbi:alpha/beta hydrolase [Dichotomicrobium thermohalophilum]|uniref:Lysophospholipase n=1 Tax=Dichotomicrobium thermohalophilum TaxID=933063 RepID=A0A397Q6G9_9HYPH|nr:alpha/beta hydrolase [Dichotomicrobium thermohalophilum]RIA56682.1 lysophospholipase [Dichotomicrobium thermohalophilum]